MSIRVTVFVLIVMVATLLSASVAGSSAATTPFSLDPDTIRPWLCNGDDACLARFNELTVPEMGELLLQRLGAIAKDMATSEEMLFPHVDAAHPHKRAMLDMASKLRTRLVGNKVAGLSNAAILEMVRDLIKGHRKQEDSTKSYPYFGVIPHYHGAAIPGGKPYAYSSPCFENIIVTASDVTADGLLNVTFDIAGPLSFQCSDSMIIGAGDAIKFELFDAAKVITVTLDVSKAMASPAQKWYMYSRGVKILRFRGSFLDMIGDLIDTVVLMTGFGQSPIRRSSFEASLHFMQDYVTGPSKRMQPTTALRNKGSIVAEQLDPTYIQSGDVMLVLRPDGLDPMIAWGEGATVGHSVIFNRDTTTNALYVCESTTHDAYWATNGIQCNAWEDWRKMAIAAEYNVVLVPLAPKYQSSFDASKAWDFFKRTEGLDYGYQTFLFGWLDTKNDNVPCLPPDYKTCLVPELVETIGLVIDGAFGNNTENFFRQAISHRLGTWTAASNSPASIPPLIDALQYAEKNFKFNSIDDIYTIPEQDEWEYHTFRYANKTAAVGKSMVCCVFVCNMWKAAGVFGEIDSKINCGEQTLWDIFSMKIFDDTKMGESRPQLCKTADPTNELCQLTGNFTLNLKPDLNTRGLYAWMGQNCSSKGPDYRRQPGC